MLPELAVAAGAIFLVNLLPAFGPPTWAVLVFAHFQTDLPPALLVPVGAVAAASGRLLLAIGARHFRDHLSPERVANLECARVALVGTRAKAYAGLGLFALSPVPSAQLFIAAGLLSVRLVPLTLAFFAGRLISYSIYLAAASAASASLESLLGDAIGSPLGIAIQLVLLAGLVALVRIDWARVLDGRNHGTPVSGATT